MTNVADSLGTVGDSLGNKVGPLPVWAWAGMAAAGVSAAILIRRRYRTGPAVVAPAAEPGVEVEGSPSPFLPGGFVIGGGPTGATGNTGPTDPPASPARPRTNSDWQQDAQRFLIGRGYQGTVVTDALARFLSGRSLTQQGAAIIDAAIAAVGAPPQPVPPPVISPAPEPLPSPGGGGIAPAPRPPSPAPAPVPYPTRPFRILRHNGGPDGPGSFVAVFLGTNGVMGWIPDGTIYAGLSSEFPVTTLSAPAFVSAVNAARHYGPKPRWLPVGARW